MPLKYLAHYPELVTLIGPVHGLLFMSFIIGTLSIGVEEKWHFRKITVKVLIACIIPFGTFYINEYIVNPPKETS